MDTKEPSYQVATASTSIPDNSSLNNVEQSNCQNQDDPGNPKMSTFRILVVWLSIALGALCVFLDEAIIATATPQITDHFNSLVDVGWYGSAYNMTFCAFQLVFGRLYTDFSTKTVFLSALAIFEAGSIICATAPSSIAFIIGRSVAGWGAAGMSSGAFVLLQVALPPEKLPTYLGALGMIYGIGAVIGPTVGGIITNSYLTWRWCFWINLPIAVPTALATITLIKTPPISTADNKLDWKAKLLRLDPLGICLLLPSVISLVLAIQYGGTLATWSDHRTIISFVVAGILFVLFAIQQWRMGENGLLPPRILSQRVVLCGTLFAFTLDSGFYTLVYYLPLWFQAILGVSPEGSGIRYLSMVIPLVLAVFGSGAAVTKLGYYQPFMLAGTILLSVGAGMLSRLHPGSGMEGWMPYMIIAGLGIGLSTQMPAIAVQSTVSEADMPISVAVVLFGQALGPTIFISAAQAVLAGVLTTGLANAIPGLDAERVKNAGATELPGLVRPDQVAALLDIYSFALTRTYLVAASTAAVSVIAIVLIGWKRIATPGEEEGIEKDGLQARASKASTDSTSV